MSEIENGYKCEDCEAIVLDFDVDFDNPLYECQSCGTRFLKYNSYMGDNHQCPECMKFASKVADFGCPECEEGELTEIEIYETKDGWAEYGLEDKNL